MPVYIRSVTPTRWASLDPTDPKTINDAVRELLAKGNCVSVYQSSSPDETELIAVALSSKRRSIKPFRYVEISETDLSNASVAAPIASPANTPLDSANDLHRDLRLDAASARRLVQTLASRSVPVARIAPADLKALAKKLQAQGSPIPKESRLLK